MITARDKHERERTRNISLFYKIHPIQFRERESEDEPYETPEQRPEQEARREHQPERLQPRNPGRERRPAEFLRDHEQYNERS